MCTDRTDRVILCQFFQQCQTESDLDKLIVGTNEKLISNSFIKKPDLIQQLVWGETGTFVRRLLWEEENE